MGTVSFQRSTHVIRGAGERAHVLVATISGRLYQQAFSDARQEAVLNAIETGIDVTNLHITNCRIDEGRNTAVRQLKETEADYILFLDDDMLIPHDLVQRLVAASRTHKADVVGCMYTSRTIPPRLIVLDIEGEHFPLDHAKLLHMQGMVIDVGAVGCGATLVRAETFEKVPYFTFADGESEDFGFCRRVREAGGRVMCDFGVSSRLHGRTYPGVAHLGVYPYSLEDALCT